MKLKRADQMLSAMQPGMVYRQADLQVDWPNASHDLKDLLLDNKIRKVSAGLYYKPKKTKYGLVAPPETELVREFLRDEDFLLLDVNQYSSLVSGLTQLSMGSKVLNRRRHGIFELAGFPFDFRVRRDFPKKVSKSFLMVDLLDNLSQTENGSSLKDRVLERLSEYNKSELLEMARLYGNRSTQIFLNNALAN